MQTRAREQSGGLGSVSCRNRFGGGACVAFVGAAVLAHAAPDQVRSTREDLSKWVETRRIISAEKNDWLLGKEVLVDRIEIVRHEIAALREKIVNAEQGVTETDKKHTELVDENEGLKQASGELVDVVEGLEEKTRSMLVRLPDPIRNRVRPLSQRIPEVDAEEESKLSLAERFQNVVGVLNEVNKFNREITVVSEVRALGGGTSAEVTAMYVGVGQGYYVGAQGSVAGVGYPTDGAWEWRPMNAAAAEITAAIEIINSERAAAFVQLPVDFH